jgi:YHS domain-containing protein
MARLALFGIFVVLLILIARAIFPSKSSSDEEPTEMVMDPNNGVYIPKSEAIKKTIDGKEYYFSSEQSAEEFINKTP